MTPWDEELYDRFVAVIRGLRMPATQIQIERIGPRTLQRYLEGERPTRLKHQTRLAMASYLANSGVEGYEEWLTEQGWQWLEQAEGWGDPAEWVWVDDPELGIEGWARRMDAPDPKTAGAWSQVVSARVPKAEERTVTFDMQPPEAQVSTTREKASDKTAKEAKEIDLDWRVDEILAGPESLPKKWALIAELAALYRSRERLAEKGDAEARSQERREEIQAARERIAAMREDIKLSRERGAAFADDYEMGPEMPPPDEEGEKSA